MTVLTQQRLKELLFYNPETGYWLDRRTGNPAGCVDHGYLRIIVDRQKYYGHRLAFLYMTGEWPPKNVDHKDANGLNNKWDNLRVASKSQNGANRGAQKTNKSGMKGVSFCASTCRWRADINPNGKRINLGRFNKKEEAAAAYLEAAKRYFGEFARS